MEENTIKEIYERDNSEEVTGKEAWDLYIKTIQNSKKKSAVLTKVVSDYSQAMKEITHKIKDMQKDIFECFRKATVSEVSAAKMNRMTEGERFDTTANSLRESSVSAMGNEGDNNDRKDSFGL